MRDHVRVYRWSVHHVPALPSEPNCPQPWTFLPSVAFYVGDPKLYFEKLHATMLDRAHHNQMAATKTAQLIQKTKTPQEAAVAIRDFVAKSIRTAGPLLGELPMDELSTADTTLTDGYGHNADEAILLYSMLNAAGLKPEFVLMSEFEDISSTNNKVRSFPIPQLFNSVLVKIIIDGEPYYLNDTDQYARLGSVASAGRLGIRLSDQSFEFVQPANGCKDRGETIYQIALATDGKARIHISNKYYGLLYEDKKQFFSELPPEERRLYHQKLVTSMAHGAKPTSELVTNFESYPGTEEFSVDIQQYAMLDGKRLLFKLPDFPEFHRISDDKRPMFADERKLPMLLASEPERLIRMEIEWPKNFSCVTIAPKGQEFSVFHNARYALINSGKANSKWLFTEQFESKDPRPSRRGFY